MLKFTDIFPELLADLSSYKIHMAIEANNNNPLHAFFRGGFKEWQEWQTKKNFKRPYILSLIYYRSAEWLFAGIYQSISCIEIKNENHVEYTTKLLDIRKT